MLYFMHALFYFTFYRSLSVVLIPCVRIKILWLLVSRIFGERVELRSCISEPYLTSPMSSVVRWMSKVTVAFVLRRYHNWWSSVGPAVPLLAIDPSRLPALASGTTRRSTSYPLLRYMSSKVVLRLTCLSLLSFNSFVQYSAVALAIIDTWVAHHMAARWLARYICQGCVSQSIGSRVTARHIWQLNVTKWWRNSCPSPQPLLFPHLSPPLRRCLRYNPGNLFGVFFAVGSTF